MSTTRIAAATSLSVAMNFWIVARRSSGTLTIETFASVVLNG
jgi:hypothetical protein